MPTTLHPPATLNRGALEAHVDTLGLNVTALAFTNAGSSRQHPHSAARACPTPSTLSRNEAGGHKVFFGRGLSPAENLILQVRRVERGVRRHEHETHETHEGHERGTVAGHGERMACASVVSLSVVTKNTLRGTRALTDA